MGIEQNFEAFLVGIVMGVIAGTVVGTLLYDIFYPTDQAKEQQHD